MQAVIIAGGKGTRMLKNFPNTPKLLISLKGKPFLDHIIEHLKTNEFQSIIICTGYLANKIKDYVERKDYGVLIKLTQEKKPLGTGGILNLVKDIIEEDFFLLFGDVYSEINLKKMLAFHKKKKAVVTAAIHPSEHPKDSNLVKFNSDARITKILKKPHTQIPTNPYNLAAVYLVSKNIKKYLLAKTPYDFEHNLLTKLLDENVPIYGYNTRELTMDLGTPKRLSELEKLLRK